MKKLFILCFVFLTMSLYAANLVNKDSKKYTIDVKTVGTTHTSIDGNTTKSGGAPDGSEVTVKETGSTLKVNGSNEVIIKDGKLSQ